MDPTTNNKAHEHSLNLTGWTWTVRIKASALHYSDPSNDRHAFSTVVFLGCSKILKTSLNCGFECLHQYRCHSFNICYRIPIDMTILGRQIRSIGSSGYRARQQIRKRIVNVETSGLHWMRQNCQSSCCVSTKDGSKDS